MPRISLAFALAFCALVPCLAQAATREVIPAGTILQCTVDEPNFSSKTALPGDPLLCHLGPLGSFGHSVFPRGAELGGHLEDFKNPGHFVGKGWMQVEFDRLIVPGSEPVPLATKIISAPHMRVDPQGDIHGRGHPKRDVVEWMIPILWPIKIATLPARGPYPAFKGESKIALRVMEDIDIPYARNVPVPPWASPASYSNAYNSAGDALQKGASAPSSGVTLMMRPASFVQRSEPETASVSQVLTPAVPMTIIALKDGAAVVARQYWLEGGKLQWTSESGEQKSLPVEKVDLYRTTSLNRERNVDFVLQSHDAVEQ